MQLAWTHTRLQRMHGTGRLCMHPHHRMHAAAHACAKLWHALAARGCAPTHEHASCGRAADRRRAHLAPCCCGTAGTTSAVPPWTPRTCTASGPAARCRAAATPTAASMRRAMKRRPATFCARGARPCARVRARVFPMCCAQRRRNPGPRSAALHQRRFLTTTELIQPHPPSRPSPSSPQFPTQVSSSPRTTSSLRPLPTARPTSCCAAAPRAATPSRTATTSRAAR